MVDVVQYPCDTTVFGGLTLRNLVQFMDKARRIEESVSSMNEVRMDGRSSLIYHRHD